jgi:hypothetical protein
MLNLMVNRRKAIDIGERKGIWLPQVDDLRTFLGSFVSNLTKVGSEAFLA